MIIIFDIEANREILTKVFANYQLMYHINFHMWLYYCGVTDINHHYSMSTSSSYDDIFINEFNLDAQGVGEYGFLNDRFTRKINTNFIGKFIDEEVSYSIGRNLNYISHTGDDKIVEAIRLNLANWKEDHDSNLFKNMLIYTQAYELYYINMDAEFSSRVISPRHGIAYVDNYDNVIFFLHIFRQPYDTKIYVDIYTESEIIHCDEVFNEISPRNSHPFGQVPVGITNLSDEGWLNSIYHKCKGLQDAYEQNLSDCSQEIGEFRNSYLILNNLSLQNDDLAEMKKKGIILTKGKEGTATWLEKNANDAFLQNTLQTIEDKLYQVSCHLNHNDKISSNVSSLAIRAKLIALEEKCRLNEKAFSNCIKTRLKMLFAYLKNLKGTNYDYRDVRWKYTANVPADDTANANIVSQLGDKLPTDVALSLFSFIDNPQLVAKQVEEQNKANLIGADLLNNASGSHANGGAD